MRLRKKGILNQGASASITQEGKLYLIGSHTEESKNTIQKLREKGYAMFSITRKMIEEEDSLISAINELDSDKLTRMVITSPVKMIHDAKVRKRISETIAKAYAFLNIRLKPDLHLYIEGGETASEIVHSMNWDQLRVIGQYNIGIVTLKIGKGNPVMTVKPGSYQWPDEYFV